MTAALSACKTKRPPRISLHKNSGFYENISIEGGKLTSAVPPRFPAYSHMTGFWSTKHPRVFLGSPSVNAAILSARNVCGPSQPHAEDLSKTGGPLRCAAPGMYFCSCPLMSCTMTFSSTDTSLEGFTAYSFPIIAFEVATRISHFYTFVKGVFEYLSHFLRTGQREGRISAVPIYKTENFLLQKQK